MSAIIVISGKQYSGKDTFAKILLNKMPNFKRIGIGDAIKIEYGKRHNLTFEQIEKDKHLYRSDLIKLGDWGRSISPYYWLEIMSGMDNIIVPDVRVEDEINFFKSRGAFLIRVNSKLENRAKRGIIVEVDNPTETALDNYNDWDYVVDNDSDLDYLIQQADKVIGLLKNFIG